MKDIFLYYFQYKPKTNYFNETKKVTQSQSMKLVSINKKNLKPILDVTPKNWGKLILHNVIKAPLFL